MSTGKRPRKRFKKLKLKGRSFSKESNSVIAAKTIKHAVVVLINQDLPPRHPSSTLSLQPRSPPRTTPPSLTLNPPVKSAMKLRSKQSSTLKRRRNRKKKSTRGKRNRMAKGEMPFNRRKMTRRKPRKRRGMPRRRRKERLEMARSPPTRLWPSRESETRRQRIRKRKRLRIKKKRLPPKKSRTD